MKKRFFPIMLLAAALGITSCTDDSLAEGAGGNLTEDDGTQFYVNASITLPSSAFTRSKTDKDGDTNSDANPDSEIGADYENEVRSVLLVIADKDNKYISHSVVQNLNAKTDGTYEVIGGFKTTDLQAAYDNTGGKTPLIDATNNKVNIYAFCNYTARLLDLFEGNVAGETKDNWINWKGIVEEGPSPAGQQPTISNTIWAKRSFLMTNSEQVEATFPATIDEWEPYSDKSKPYDIVEHGKSEQKTIRVERAAARLDFKDGSPEGENTYPIETSVYAKKETTEETDTPEGSDDDGDDDVETPDDYVTKNFYNVKLTRMALVNMSKNFYYLRRVSDDGMPKDETNSNNWKVGGKETIINTVKIGTENKNIFNYVVDTDADMKKKEKGITAENESNYFNFALFDKDENYNKEGWYIDNISTVLGKEADNWNNKSYHVWRYVTENTIPAASTTPGTTESGETTVTGSNDSQQKTVQSTGIVFKGAITPGEHIGETSEKVQEALANSAKGNNTGSTSTYEFPVLYSFNNTLYAGYEELIRDAKEDGEGGPLYNAVNKILANWKLVTDEKTPSSGKFELNPKNIEGKKFITLNVDTCVQILDKDLDFTLDFQTAGDDGDKEIMELAANSGITVYEATNENDEDGWGYYCYYFYWNRHNDNGLSGKMGQMEFATVRNNVYKLSVSKISQLGHPRDTKHDPDPVEPEDPDEDPTNYLKVNVEVLPWVVRVNDIEF